MAISPSPSNPPAGPEPGYLCLTDHVRLVYLEQPCVYDRARDELYELDTDALSFLAQCDGSRVAALSVDERGLVDFCVAHDLLAWHAAPQQQLVRLGCAPDPSLRYLELQLTSRCNLRCRHCYLPDSGLQDLPLADARTIVEQFAACGGLRVLVSGGEPLLYPHLAELLAIAGDLGLRRVVLTNGTLVARTRLSGMGLEELQISIDGWRQGHEQLRGPGSFDRALQGLEAARDAGVRVAVATMVHAGNLDELDRLEAYVRARGVARWSLDVPCVAGRMQSARHVQVLPEQAAPHLARAFGGSYHGDADGYACGRHLLAVMPDGTAVPCGLYPEHRLGRAADDLLGCWRQRPQLPLAALACATCRFAPACGGGCRFRAPDPLAPDPVMCAVFRRQHADAAQPLIGPYPAAS